MIPHKEQKNNKKKTAARLKWKFSRNNSYYSQPLKSNQEEGGSEGVWGMEGGAIITYLIKQIAGIFSPLHIYAITAMTRPGKFTQDDPPPSTKSSVAPSLSAAIK